MELVDALRTELGGAAGADAVADDLEARLRVVVARGQEAHPALALDAATFVRHLARCIPSGTADVAGAIDALAVADLFLACACARGVPGAAARFEEQCGARIHAAVASAVRSPELRVEVEQRVRDLLIVGTAAVPPRIGNYSGQGPLAKWAVVVAQRQVVTVLRGNEVEQRARDGAAAEAALHRPVAPEVAYAKQRYREAFEESLRLALPALEARDRMLLRLHLVSGTSTERIGKMYGVSQPTASRWVARAREALSTELQRLLRERLRLSPDEVASMAGVVASQIDASVSRLLRAP